MKKKIIGKPAEEENEKKSEDASPSKPALKMGGMKRVGGPLKMGGGGFGKGIGGGLKGLN